MVVTTKNPLAGYVKPEEIPGQSNDENPLLQQEEEPDTSAIAKEEQQQAQPTQPQDEQQETGTLQHWMNQVPTQALFIPLVVVIVILLLLLFLRGKKGKSDSKDGVDSSIIEKTDADGIQNMPTKGLMVKCSVIHEIGARNEQQDSYSISDCEKESLFEKKGFLAIVADGMGGLTNGGQVSNLLTKYGQELFESSPEYLMPADLLLEIVSKCNYQVNQLLRNGQRSGSTLVMAHIKDGYLHFLTIGDSHLYLYRNEGLILLNREHVFGEELALKAVNGMAPVIAVSQDKQAGSLTSYLGEGRLSHIDRNQKGLRLLPGDKLLLCSDGVYGTLTETQMEQALSLDGEMCTEQMQKLIEDREAKYQDNYTALLLEYNGV